ncbi:CoA transferase, partial [Bradyrhizobium sp. BRP19]
LIESCDILLDGRDIDAADCPPLDLATIRQRHPGLIHLEADWFDDVGPYANFAATDSTIRALTGLIKLVGPIEGPPMHAPDFQTGILAGLWGFIAASSSVLGRMQDGRGRASRLSIFESAIAVTEYIMFESFSRGDVMRRI